jgi:RNA polymerase sigma-70 factor, ECF subfamily
MSAIDYARRRSGELLYADEAAAGGEAVLLARLKAGDIAAFRVVFQRCNQRLFRVARSILQNDAEAEDAVQEVYLHAFANLGTYRGEGTLATWLTRIAINECRGRLRRRRTGVPVEEIDAAQQAGRLPPAASQSGACGDPEAETARREARRLLERATERLPEPFRLVFIMRDVDACSVAETAAALHLFPATVNTRLYRARRLMRAAMAEAASPAMGSIFPFLGTDCARLTARVLQRLA